MTSAFPRSLGTALLCAAALLPSFFVTSVAAAAPPRAKRPAAAPPPAPPVPEWRRRVDTVLADAAFKHASVGVLVRSLDTGRVLYQRNPDLALMPASNMKILTASIALARLGPTYQFKTGLWYTGEIDKNGTLHGDLYLRGSGDPSLNSQRLLEMAQALKDKGVRRIDGRIVGDGSAFDDQLLGEGWQWDDEPYYYQAQVSGLNCDENVIQVTVTPGAQVGDAAKVTLGGDRQMSLGFEKSEYVQVNNLVTTVTPGPEVKPAVRFDRARAKNEVTVRGTIPTGTSPVSEPMTIEDPARFTASRFADICDAVADISLPSANKRKIETGITPPDAVEIVTSLSLPLTTVIRDFLKPSDNLYGEALLKAVGKEVKGKGSSAMGATALREWLKEQGIDDSGLYVADGSGLSRMDNVTPRLLVDVLTAVATRLPAEQRDTFRNGLPEGGTDGTLRSRFKNTFAQGRVHAKTGTLGGVSSLSGYVVTKAGERLVFSILMNNYDRTLGSSRARAAQDGIVLAICDVPTPPVSTTTIVH